MHYYVAVGGNDNDPGTKEAPFATFERARDVVREQIQKGLREPITVTIGEGVYYTGHIV